MSATHTYRYCACCRTLMRWFVDEEAFGLECPNEATCASRERFEMSRGGSPSVRVSLLTSADRAADSGKTLRSLEAAGTAWSDPSVPRTTKVPCPARACVRPETGLPECMYIEEVPGHRVYVCTTCGEVFSNH